ncbi:MAG: 4-hydroxy-tetrahydrodipicolinate reductase [Bdellovibrio sp.]|nr:MAG: 4-hydroxy-tetrahydrodipicolinate reductase [Bdellovibrio sp.]
MSRSRTGRPSVSRPCVSRANTSRAKQGRSNMAGSSPRMAINGARGRMGREILALIEADSRQGTCALAIDQSTPPGEISSMAADLVIDFSSPQGLTRICQILAKHPLPLLSGTTGLDASHERLLRALSRKAPVLWTSNTSLGIAALKKALRSLKMLGEFDFHVEEIHHKKKVDAPSGTARTLQQELTSLKLKNLSSPVSLRAGGVPGLHRVWAIGENEWLCFEHMAFNRKLFAQGALQLALLLYRRPPGFYSVEDLLG